MSNTRTFITSEATTLSGRIVAFDDQDIPVAVAIPGTYDGTWAVRNVANEWLADLYRYPNGTIAIVRSRGDLPGRAAWDVAQRATSVEQAVAIVAGAAAR